VTGTELLFSPRRKGTNPLRIQTKGTTQTAYFCARPFRRMQSQTSIANSPDLGSKTLTKKRKSRNQDQPQRENSRIRNSSFQESPRNRFAGGVDNMWLELTRRTDLPSHSEVSFARVVRFALHSAGAQLNHVVSVPRRHLDFSNERRCRAARQMRVGPSGSACRSGSQTT